MNFDSLAKEFFPDSLLNKSQDIFLNKSEGIFTEDAGLESHVFGSEARSLQLDQEHAIQKFIRPNFSKSDQYNQSPIGFHPDYSSLLKNGGFKKGYIATLFMDIVKSTRLNLLYDLEVACEIKNRILKTSIEVVRAFDGYPHRMMGDAMMAFFGDSETSEEQACINAVNCACVLKYFVENFVVPQIDSMLNGKDSKLGIRIGVDYGSDENVIWGAFGYRSAYEITAHGISVDLCSKLQGMADKNSIMLGRGILELIDFPALFTRVKSKGDTNIYVVKPDITDANGNHIGYKCRLIADSGYFDLLPFSPVDKGLIDPGSPLSDVIFVCEYSRDGTNWIEYKSVSYPLDKDLYLRFSVYVPSRLFEQMRRFEYKFTRVNHGLEAFNNNEDVGAIEYLGDLSYSDEHCEYNGAWYKVATHNESTSYRGIHEMRFTGSFNGSAIPGKYSNTIGIVIR